ncbi:MAG: DNA repair protein RecN [Thermodesulfobacteriota bacterium]
MLRELLITNLALVERLHISLGEGLTVFTGETGAGKSIILQAIHLLAGGKAGATWIRSGAETATVEALFELEPRHAGLRRLLAEAGCEEGEELVVKRVISLKGGSRYFVNGSLATAKLVAEVVENLLSVASQHDHQQLLQPRSHLDFVDAVGGLMEKRARVGQLYDAWREAEQQYADCRVLEQDKERRRDLLAFECQEIAEAAVSAGEDEELIQERDRLRAADDLISLGRKSHHLLSAALSDPLAVARKQLEQMAAFDSSIGPLVEEIAGNCFQLEDQAQGLRRYLDGVVTDPARLDQVGERLDLLQRLKRKYGGELEAVIAHGREAAKELAEIEAMDERLAALDAARQDAARALLAEAGELSQARRVAAEQLAGAIREALRGLCFEQAIFAIDFRESTGEGLAAMTRLGGDRPEFLFSANPGEAAKPLAKVASGGELSRVMLALKTILARQDQVGTVLFDEIDAGISGRAAEAVARSIRQLAGHHQVLCITHLPQIASLADEHLLVRKEVAEGRTRTSITPLPVEAREHELARMLDGDSVSQETMAYVRTLVERRTQP